MSKKLRLQRGEIATIITIVSLVVLGASTLVSSVFLSKNKQTTSTKAAEPVTCTSANNWNCTGQTQTCGGVACGKCAQRTYDGGWSRCVGPNCQRNQSSIVYNYPVFDTDDSCIPTITAIPTTKTPTPSSAPTSCPAGQCKYSSTCVSKNTVKSFNYGSRGRCCYPGTSSEWIYGSGTSDPPVCSDVTAAPTATPTRVPGNELPGYENCNRCCIQDLQCGIPADGNGYKCGKEEIRIRWYSYNCTSSCSNFGSGALTKFIDCPPDVGRENRLKCLSGAGICSTYYGGGTYPTAVPTAVPTTGSGVTSNTCTKSGYHCINNTNQSNLTDCHNAGYSIESFDFYCGQNDLVCCYGTLTPSPSLTPTTATILPSGTTTYPTGGISSCRATSKITVGGIECNDPLFGNPTPAPCGGILACSNVSQGIFVYRQCSDDNNSQSECRYRCLKNNNDTNCKGGADDEKYTSFLSVFNNSQSDIILTNVGLFHVNNKGKQIYKTLSYTLKPNESVSFDFQNSGICSGGLGEIMAHVVYNKSGDSSSYNVNSSGSDRCPFGLNIVVVID